MRTVICRFPGILNLAEINDKVAEMTGDDEPIFSGESNEWKRWIEYEDGDTLIVDYT